MRRLLFCLALVVSLFCFWKAVSVDAAGNGKQQATPNKQQASANPADSHGAFSIPVPEGSAAQQAAAVLPGCTVVGAFHHVSAVLLLDPEVGEFDLDVMVLGDDRHATDLVQALAERIPGVRGVYAGRLRNCGQVEALTCNLVSVNRRYKGHAGLRVTDI